MPLKSFRGERGSALLEFIVTVLIGQTLLLGLSYQFFESLDRKVRLDLAGQQLARAESLGRFPELMNVLQQDFLPGELRADLSPCSLELVCVVTRLGDQAGFGVSLSGQK